MTQPDYDLNKHKVDGLIFEKKGRYQGQKKQNEIDIQQLKFAGGHPPNYYAAGRMLKYARADGMACSHSPMVVCVRKIDLTTYIPLKMLPHLLNSQKNQK